MASSKAAKRATGKGTPVVAEKKATTSVHIPDVDISAVVAMEKRVKGELTEHAQFWRIAKPLLSIQSERLSKLLASKGELFTNGGSISDDYESGMKNASKVYKVGLSLSGEIAQESKDLLFFLWRGRLSSATQFRAFRTPTRNHATRQATSSSNDMGDE